MEFLDVVLDIIHLTVIGINLFFWSVRGIPRRVFYAVYTSTWISWLVLGYWYGWGYCFLTDYHWQVKRELGYTQLPNSYIVYILEEFAGFAAKPKIVDVVTASVFIVLFLIYIILLAREPNVRSMFKKTEKTS